MITWAQTKSNKNANLVDKFTQSSHRFGVRHKVKIECYAEGDRRASSTAGQAQQAYMKYQVSFTL